MSALLKGVIGSHRLLKNVDFASTLEVVCLALGALIAIILTFTGTLSTTSTFTVLLFQLAWAVLIFVLMLFRKN